MMLEKYPAFWQPVGLMKVPTLSRELPKLVLGRARHPSMLSSRALLHHKTAEEEEYDEEVGEDNVNVDEEEVGMEVGDSDGLI